MRSKMNSQQWQTPQQQSQSNQQQYQQVPPYQQQVSYGYQQQSYTQYQQPYQSPYPQQPVSKPSYLTTGWKVLYVILGMVMPVVALLVAFIRSSNSQTGDAELREALRYTLIGFLAEIIIAVILVIFGLSAIIGIATLM